MDIRKLQRAIVDGLEDVKAQNILVFNTEHLSSLFERVIIASGTSNRQTKSLATSVRESVKSAGYPVPRTEGETNGEWIIVDCGAAVVHVMQPVIREYYHLEEIWGGKLVKVKLDDTPVSLVKASEPAKKSSAKTPAKVPAKAPAEAPAKNAAAKAAPARSAPVKAAPAKAPAAKRPMAKAPPAKAPAGTATAARKAPPKKGAAPMPRMVTRVVGIKKAPAKKVAATKAPVRRAAAPASRSPARKAPASKAPAKKATRRA